MALESGDDRAGEALTEAKEFGLLFTNLYHLQCY